MVYWAAFKQVMTQEEYNAFYSVDRRLYSILVHDLRRDPIEAMQMMAVWIWLERMGLSIDLTRRIQTLPFQLIDEIGDEALLCWSCLSKPEILYSSYASEIPLTLMFLREEVSLQFLQKNRSVAITGINNVINNVCPKCFKDIMDDAEERNGRLAFLESMSQLGFFSEREIASHEQVTIPQSVGIHPDNRAMFVTFSNGYPVAEWEVRDFFTRHLGDCVEAFFMQEVSDGEQPLFARVVFYEPSYIQTILGDDDAKVKFTINKKHVWMRKFIPRRPRGTSVRRSRSL